jgi:hypothetical protein
MDMYTGQRHHDRNGKANKQCNIENLFHAALASTTGMVLMPKRK